MEVAFIHGGSDIELSDVDNGLANLNYFWRVQSMRRNNVITCRVSTDVQWALLRECDHGRGQA